MDGLSASDVALLSENNRNSFFGDDMWGFLMFALIFGGWGGNGFGFGGNRGGGSFMGGYDVGNLATKSDVSNGFALSALNTGIDNIRTGQFGLETNLCNSFANVNSAIANLGFNLQQCLMVA